PRRVDRFREVRHSPCARRIIRQAAHVRIVFTEPLFHEFGGPGLIWEATGEVFADVECEWRAADFKPAELACGRHALIDRGSVPDAGEVRFPVGEPRRWGG